MKSQMASPSFSAVYAALVAVVNSRLPDIGKLLLTRLVLQFKRAYKRNDKPVCAAAVKFIAQLVNQVGRVLMWRMYLHVASPREGGTSTSLSKLYMACGRHATMRMWTALWPLRCRASGLSNAGHACMHGLAAMRRPAASCVFIIPAT